MKTYMYESFNPEDFRVIHQSGVKQACFPPEGPHAACWDGLMAPDGRVYVAAGTEGALGEYVKLCEYHYADNRFSDLFYGKDVFMAPERAITSSKFHFSMDVMADGRIIAASHTTDKAPAHPVWMYKQYYPHMWEGYPGSSLVVFDPKSGKAEHLGIITPRETIYGGVYNPADQGYYCLGFIRGHLYRYSLKTRRLTDFGKVSEWKTFRLHLGPDGHIYGASKSGFLFRLDTGTDRIVDLNYRILAMKGGAQASAKSMAATANIPGSSKFLFTLFSAAELYSHDTATHETEHLGNLRSADAYCKGIVSNECAYSMKLDSDNVLWYALTCYPKSDMNGDLTFRRAASLMRWDVLRGGKPECLGVIGTPERVHATVTSLMLDNERGILYLTDSNHGEDGMSLLAIDMHKFKPHMHEPGPPSRDPFMVKDHPRYLAMSNQAMANHKFNSANSPDLVAERIVPVLLWRSCRAEDSKVLGLVWENDQTVCGICGDDGEAKFAFKVSAAGDMLEFVAMEDLDARYRKWLVEHVLPQPPPADRPKLDLPHINGRRYKAIPNVEVSWNQGRSIIGTLDGLLAVVDGQAVFSLGSAAANGPVHCLTTNREKTVCYGVAGDAEDLGMVFCYTDERGLRQLGHVKCDDPCPNGVASSDALSSIVMNEAGDLLAVGAKDRLGVVYLITLNP